MMLICACGKPARERTNNRGRTPKTCKTCDRERQRERHRKYYYGLSEEVRRARNKKMYEKYKADPEKRELKLARSRVSSLSPEEIERKRAATNTTRLNWTSDQIERHREASRVRNREKMADPAYKQQKLQRQRDRRNLLKVEKAPSVNECHPDRKYHAKGLCARCYERERIKNMTPEEYADLRARNRVASKKSYYKDLDRSRALGRKNQAARTDRKKKQLTKEA
jgi:hypothetical protein